MKNVSETWSQKKIKNDLESVYILSMSLNVYRHDLRANNFDSIYRKYV
jgi:hypothetical protein